MTKTLDKKKILDFIANLSGIVKKEEWISHYDADSDSLTLRTPKLSEDSRKKYFNDEFAFYLNRKSDVEGIFIEYFVSNFVSHHKDFKEVIRELKNDKKVGESIVELKKSEVRKLAPGLEGVIINSLIPNQKLQKIK